MGSPSRGRVSIGQQQNYPLAGDFAVCEGPTTYESSPVVLSLGARWPTRIPLTFLTARRHARTSVRSYVVLHGGLFRGALRGASGSPKGRTLAGKGEKTSVLVIFASPSPHRVTICALPRYLAPLSRSLDSSLPPRTVISLIRHRVQRVTLSIALRNGRVVSFANYRSH